MGLMMRKAIWVGVLSAMLLFFLGGVLFVMVDEGGVIIGTLLTSAMIGVGLYLSYPFLWRLENKPRAVMGTFLFVFYLLGLLPLSSRRDYIDYQFWSACLAIALVSYVVGWSFGARRKNQGRIAAPASLHMGRFYALFSISAVMVVYILAKYGLLINNPEARFSVSTVVIYFIEFSLIASLAYVVLKSDPRSISRSFVFVALAFLMLLTTGYRNQAVLLIYGTLLAFYLKAKEKQKVHKARRFAVSIVVASLMVVIGYTFYLRVENSGADVISWSGRIAEFDYVLPEFMLPLLPIHESARETLGVADVALDHINEIDAVVPRWLFIFMDFSTLLPGVSATATGLLGQVVNQSYEAFLVPGALGGLYISFGLTGILVYFLLLGLSSGYLWRRYTVCRDSAALLYLIVLIVYSTQFLYRGVFKPMYVAAFIVVYLLIDRKRRGVGRG
jgi:hypothetical protein